MARKESNSDTQSEVGAEKIHLTISRMGSRKGLSSFNNGKKFLMIDKSSITRKNRKEIQKFIMFLKPITVESYNLEIWETALFNLYNTGYAYSKPIDYDNDEDIKINIYEHKQEDTKFDSARFNAKL